MLLSYGAIGELWYAFFSQKGIGGFYIIRLDILITAKICLAAHSRK